MMKTLENTLAILVLYNHSLEESETYQSLDKSLASSNSTLDILLYDNSPVKRYEEQNFTRGNMHIIYISDIRNSGVSHAYNTGWELAKKMNKRWVLLLDQDTLFPINSIEKYGEQVKMGQPLCAPLLALDNGYFSSPCDYKWGIGRPMKHVQTGLLDLHHKSILNSGLLINLDVFREIGGYNENIPLDFSDHEWFERVKLHYKTIYIMDLVCKHDLSVMETDVTKVLNRFKYYLKGAKEYQKNKAPFGLAFIVFLRTIKLSLRFKTLDFLRCYLNQ